MAVALVAGGPLAADEAPESRAAATLSEAVRALRVGDRVVVTGPSGETLRGRVESPGPLTVSPPGAAAVEVVEADVARLAVLRADPLWNGALIGLAVGASVVLAADCNSPGCDEVQPYAVPAVLALGVGVGALVDHLHRGEVVLYEAGPDRGRAALSVAPLIGPARRGIAFTLRWGSGRR